MSSEDLYLRVKAISAFGLLVALKYSHLVFSLNLGIIMKIIMKTYT